MWWGQQIQRIITVKEKDYVVAENIEEALVLAKEKTNNQQLTTDNLKQDEDALDTWFFLLWPMSVFDGMLDENNEDIKYYYPTWTW